MVGQVPPDPKLALGQIESMAYLRNQLLRDSDWASMDHGVELRTPLVDATLLHGLRPVLSQFEKYQNKTLLSQSLLKPLPQAISSRRKTGFGIPVERWLNDISPVVSKETRFAWAAHVADAYGTTV
jgi:asparagine synthase (glutamine-hydrolysing)